MRSLAISMMCAVLLLGACAGEDGSGGDTATPGEDPATALPGKTYLSTDATGHDIVDGSTIRLTFDESGRLGVNAGCNSMSGSWAVEDGHLVVPTDQLASTQMACLPELMEQDQWVSTFLGSGPEVTVSGTTLTLTGDEAGVTFEEEQPTALVGTAWTLTSLISADAVSSLPADAEGSGAGITLPDATALQLSTGCNNGRGTATVTETDASAGSIELGPIALTKKACLSDGGREVENALVTVLDGTVTYTIDGDRLTVMNGDQGLVFSATP